MEYQKIINLLDNTLNQPTKFTTKNWIKVNVGSYGVYNTSSQIKFKISMIRSSLCDYSDGYILVKSTITFPNNAAAATAPNNTNKKVTFKNFAPFTEKDHFKDQFKEIDHAKDIDVVMPMCNLKEYNDNYSKTTGSSCQCYRD